MTKIRIDNSFKRNRAERSAKTYVMGRKNFLFHDTVAGAEASTMLYSIVETARANNLNVYHYLLFTLSAVSGYEKQLGNIENYLPWTDFIQDPYPYSRDHLMHIRGDCPSHPEASLQTWDQIRPLWQTACPLQFLGL